jgi:predicted dehydrogenase
VAGSDAPALRIALIGCGGWGVHVLRDLRQCGCHVQVVARSEMSRRNAAAGGAERVVGTIEALRDPIDAAVVVTSALAHVELIEQLLRRWPDVPIYCEKPLCIDPQRAARAALEWPRVYVMHKWRYHPGILELAAIARRADLGPVQSLRLHREQWGAPRRDIDPVWTHLPHDLAIVLEVLGHIPEVHSARIDRYEGAAFGAMVLLGSHPWVAITMSARSATPRREVQLFAHDGVALLSDSFARDIKLLRRPPDSVASPVYESRPIADTMPLLAQIEAFLAFVGGKGPPPKGSLDEEAAIIRAIAAAYRLGEG